ncbi:MAG: CDP-alcohol phosphatidyltransferase family protein [Dehalococcoidia bacterium]|jgi:CDP-diacylglycerol--glycerol-3-phosphate 3-phosphatidyltransferase|nr:MAG: CDP-alcohol phosphatidyltransferase family protein [Dehalococcoidia bacterium]
MAKLSEIRKAVSYHLVTPLVKPLASLGISPDALSWTGFGLALVAAFLIARGYLLAGGIMVLVAASFDMLDGALARHTGKVSRFGGILDSTLDRLSEATLLVGILVLFLTHGDNSRLFWPLSHNWAIVILALVLIFSPLVSYLRARAEAAGFDCQLGIFTRTERVIVLVLGLLFNQLVIALALIAVLSVFTAGQRLLLIWRKTRSEPSA